MERHQALVETWLRKVGGSSSESKSILWESLWSIPFIRAALIEADASLFGILYTFFWPLAVQAPNSLCKKDRAIHRVD